MKTSQKAPTIGLTGVKFDDPKELLSEVLGYLCRAYEFDGNDILVETYSKDELLSMMGKSKTVSGALWAIREKTGVQHMAAHRSEIQSTAW